MTTNEPSHILWFDEPASANRALVGGKAAHLSCLAATHRVPPGFCLTALAFDHAQANGWTHNGQIVLPQSLCNELAAAYQDLAQHCHEDELAVAVRSSATDEDGTTASFAGQYETYLNIVGVEALTEAVGYCWASARSQRVLEYRRQRGLDPDKVRLAVLVQQLIAADVSAVVFSANPVTGSRDEIVMNASWGLGESIVGGRVTPDSYIVRKADFSVVSRQIAEKRRMTVLVSGGTQEVEVPRLLRTQAALDEAQVVEMAHLSWTLEQVMGWPVDAECAYQAGKLYLLQCRPITTLKQDLRPGIRSRGKLGASAFLLS